MSDETVGNHMDGSGRHKSVLSVAGCGRTAVVPPWWQDIGPRARLRWAEEADGRRGPRGSWNGRRRQRTDKKDHEKETHATVFPAPASAWSQHARGGVIAARPVRYESVPAQRASGVKLPRDASVGGMVQIHKGERVRLHPSLHPILRQLAVRDATRRGFKDFSSYAADVTAVQFGRPELARKLVAVPPRRLFFEEHGLVPVPPEDDYIDSYMRLPAALYARVAAVSKNSGVSVPQCVVNALARHLGRADLLGERTQGTGVVARSA